MSHEGCDGDATNLQRWVDQTRSDVEGSMGCVGAVSKAVLAADGKADTTTSKLCAVESKLEKLTTDNDKRHDALEKKVDAIRSALSETKAGVDEVRHVFTNQILENIRLASSFSGKDLTITESGISALKCWTVRASANIIYDSRVDPFTDQGLFDKVKKSNVAVVYFTTEGTFLWILHRCCDTTKGKFLRREYVCLPVRVARAVCDTAAVPCEGEERSSGCVVLQQQRRVVCHFSSEADCSLGNEKSNTHCWNRSQGFDGIADNTLTGKPSGRPNYHHCIRLVAIQLD